MTGGAAESPDRSWRRAGAADDLHSPPRPAPPRPPAALSDVSDSCGKAGVREVGARNEEAHEVPGRSRASSLINEPGIGQIGDAAEASFPVRGPATQLGSAVAAITAADREAPDLA